MLYFAYGSNMDEQRVKAADRCPNARFIFTAVLPGHRLVFTRGSDDGSSATDAVPDVSSQVWGVVYDITDSDRQQLDKREGVGIRPHRPKEVLVHPNGDVEQRVIVLTYGASHGAGTHLPPSREFLDHLLHGARRWSLPADYIAHLEQTQVTG
jgi:hypothetical protein